MSELEIGKKRFIPIIALILFYLLELNYAFIVASAQNDYSYIILAFTGPLPLFIGIILTTIKLIKQKG